MWWNWKARACWFPPALAKPSPAWSSTPIASACATAASWSSSYWAPRSISATPTTRSRAISIATTQHRQRFGEAAPASTAEEADHAATGHHHSTEDGRAATVAQPVKIDNDLYVRDYSRCILCYKCVEACGVDAQNTFAISVAGRGFDARISTELALPLPDSACVYCGNCIGVCPTGALMFKSEYDLRQQNAWDEERQTVTDTICPYCGIGCTLQLHVQDNSIVKVTSPLDHDVTSGHLCIKGRFGFQFVQNRDDGNGTEPSGAAG